MIKNIKGLHHVTSMASEARQNNHFFTETLGLRRVKQTVNFDDPASTTYTMAMRPLSRYGYDLFSLPEHDARSTRRRRSRRDAILRAEGSLKFWQDRLSSEGSMDWKQTLSSEPGGFASWVPTATASR